MPKPKIEKQSEAKQNVIDPKQRAYFEKLHKSAYYLTFNDLEFKDGDSGNIARTLNHLQSYPLYSKTGKELIRFYQRFKKDGLDKENPIVRRLIIGQLLMRLKSQKSAPGFIDFMKLMLIETKRINPEFKKEIQELVSIISKMPAGELKNKKIKELLGIIGQKPKQSSDFRPVDPFFGTDQDERPKGEGSTTNGYGPLESITPISGGKELMDINKLDPFQIILLKQMINGYNIFIKEVQTNKQLKQLFSYLKPHEVIKIKRQLGRAIRDLEKWMIETVNLMKASEGNKLVSIYQKQISALKLPSLPTSVKVIKGLIPRTIARGFILLIKMSDEGKNLNLNMRDLLENEIKKQFKKAVPAFKLLSNYINPFKDILARKKMFKTGKNRAFLNRFWNLAYKKFISANGGEKVMYEFMAMLFDSIKDDNELVALSSKLRPIIIHILRESKDADNLAKKQFGKKFSDLSNEELNSILTLLLPSQKTTPQMLDSSAYKKMKAEITRLFNDDQIRKLKKEHYTVYIALTTVAQNILNISASLAFEKDPAKIEQKVKLFIEGFNSIKKLLGEKGLKTIKKSSPEAVEFLENPNNKIVEIISKNRKSLISYLSNSSEANKLSNKYFGRKISELKLNELDSIIKLLLPSQIIKPKDYRTRAYIDLRKMLNKTLKNAGLESIQKQNYLVGLAIITAKQNMLNIYASLVNEKDIPTAKKKIKKFVDGFKAIKKLIGQKGLQLLKSKDPKLAYVITNPELAIAYLKINATPSVEKAISRFERLHNIKRPKQVIRTLKIAKQIKKELEKRRQTYLQNLTTQKIVKGRTLTVINHAYAKQIMKIKHDIARINAIIIDLNQTWSKKDFEKKQEDVKKALYDTRYLKISPSIQKYISLFTLKEKPKKDYKDLLYITSLLHQRISKQLQKICKAANCEFAYARLSELLENVFSTYGMEQKSQLGRMSVRKFFALPLNRKRFVKELGKRVNLVLKQSKFTDVNDKKLREGLYFSGDVGRYLAVVLKKDVIPKLQKVA